MKFSIFFCNYTRCDLFVVKLLNEKNDDEDEEARAGLKKRNELLQQLLKDQDDERKVQEQHVSNRIFHTPTFSLPVKIIR